MAEQAADTGANKQGVETLSADEYLKLLELLKINLPKGVLTPGVIARSTCPNVIQEAARIKEDLEKCRLRIAPIPRLACGKIEEALQLKEKENIEDITKMIFFRNFEDSKNETLKKRWEKQAQAGCGFRIKDTFHEADTVVLVSNAWYKNNVGIQKNAMDCFKFYLEQNSLAEDDLNYKKNGKLEFGFLSGKPTFQVDIKSISQKVIIKCNSVTGDMAGKIFTPPKEGVQAEFNTSHQYYLQAQAFLFILKEKEKMEEQPVPVRAVMVMKVKPSDEFYWGEVSEDTEKIEQLNIFCINEALPRFLAVLNLIFEKEN